jgi:transcriptional regulator with XRE-family HTH domain
VESGNVTPPSEEKLRALAKALDCDEDRLIALSGRVPEDVIKIIQKHPCEYMALIRRLRKLSGAELDKVRK